MACTQDTLSSNAEYLRAFNRKANELHIPLSGSIELTRRCNLACIHCYLGGKPKPGQELGTRAWLNLIDEIVATGCLNLLITGGEPMIRRDFADIYAHARKSGLLVTVFCGGTLVNDPIADLFAELPPRAVEITVYGATAATHDQITTVPGSFRLFKKGFEHLLDKGINVKLKTVVMKTNRHEFFEIEKMAKERGLEFRFDPAIFPDLDGGKDPLALRLDPTESIPLEFADPERAREWQKFYTRMKQVAPSAALYPCGAGRTHFHIDASGSLKPCLMADHIAYPTNGRDFLTGWRQTMPLLRAKTLAPGHKCRGCNKQVLCGYCPGFFKLENGAEDIPNDYFCTQGRLRLERIKESL